MTMRSLPNWQTACRTEFGTYTGDCTQTAEWASFHTLDPATWPNTLESVNSIVRYDQQHDGVGPTGAETAQQLAADLRARGVPFHQVFDATWEREIAQYGGLKPMIVQVLHAGGNLPGDERAVNGHAIALLRWDPVAQSGWFCDGDHPNASAPVAYTLASLVAAQPFALTVLDREIGQEDAHVSFVKNADGSITYPAHDGLAAITLDHGQAYYASQPTSTRAGCYPLHAGTYDPNGDSVVLWNDGKASRAVKANNWAIVLEDSGPRLAALITEAATATPLSQQNAALKQQVAGAQAQVTTLTAQVSTLQAQVRQAQQQMPSSSTSTSTTATTGPSAGAVQAVQAALAEVRQAASGLGPLLGAPLSALTVGGLLVALKGLGPAADAIAHTLLLLSEAVDALDQPPPPPPTQPQPAIMPGGGANISASASVSASGIQVAPPTPLAPLGILRAAAADVAGISTDAPTAISTGISTDAPTRPAVPDPSPTPSATPKAA